MEQQRSSVMVDVGEHGLKKHDIKASTVVFMIFCLIMLAFATPVEKAYINGMEAQGLEADIAVGDCGGGLVIFCVATSAIVIPMIVYQIMNKMGKVGHIVTLHGDEKTFEETFPPINQVKDAE